jgi:hypothetical protein
MTLRMLICTADSFVPSTWMKPLMVRMSRDLSPPAAKDSVRVTADSSTTSYRDERCACADPIRATPIATAARVLVAMPVWMDQPGNWLLIRLSPNEMAEVLYDCLSPPGQKKD